MANLEHLQILQHGTDAWNAWRRANPDVRPDFGNADLYVEYLNSLYRSIRDRSRLYFDSDQNNVDYNELEEQLDREAEEAEGLLTPDEFGWPRKGADLSGADFSGADLTHSTLTRADLSWANLNSADLSEANLGQAILRGADLTGARLNKSDLTEANLTRAALVETDLTDADLTGCRIYGISAWGLKTSAETKQQNLIVTPEDEHEIVTDHIEVAQFIYLLLHNEKIRDVIDTVGRKGVLLLGRFTGGRITVLERLRDELRKRGFLPMVFNFDKPETKDFTETIRLLAGLSHFVIADITNPRSAPLELQATVPECMIPFVPIIEEGEEPFAMLKDLWIMHRDWVFEPIYYSSLERLADALDTEIITPAEVRFAELLARKAEEMKGRHI
jgi:hypothetical protein